VACAACWHAKAHTLEKPEYSLAKNETLTFITSVPLEISPEIRQSVAVLA